MEIRIKTNFGETIYLTEYEGEIRLVLGRKIYTWNPEGPGSVGAIEHGGNFLHGTEYRRPGTIRGAWETIAVAEGTEYHIRTERLYCQNHIPNLEQAKEMMQNGRIKYDLWICETWNTAPGKNNEWIPAFSEQK